MNRLSDAHVMTYKIECYYDDKGITLKELLEEMYLAYVKNLKNN